MQRTQKSNLTMPPECFIYIHKHLIVYVKENGYPIAQELDMHDQFWIPHSKIGSIELADRTQQKMCSQVQLIGDVTILQCQICHNIAIVIWQD